jgi:hypothetical protein
VPAPGSAAWRRHMAATDPDRPDAGIAGRLSGRLLDLADQVRRLDPPGRHDPEQFWRAKTELAGQIAALDCDAAVCDLREVSQTPPAYQPSGAWLALCHGKKNGGAS